MHDDDDDDDDVVVDDDDDVEDDDDDDDDGDGDDDYESLFTQDVVNFIVVMLEKLTGTVGSKVHPHYVGDRSPSCPRVVVGNFNQLRIGCSKQLRSESQAAGQLGTHSQGACCAQPSY